MLSPHDAAGALVAWGRAGFHGGIGDGRVIGDQPGFFDLAGSASGLSKTGDPLERLAGVVDSERPERDRARQRSDRTKGGCPPPCRCSRSYTPNALRLVRPFGGTVAEDRVSLDEAEFQIQDGLTFMRFLGLGGEVLDYSTIWPFREAQVVAGAVDGLFIRFDAEPKERGHFALAGQVIDTSIVEAPKQRLTDEYKTRNSSQSQSRPARQRRESGRIGRPGQEGGTSSPPDRHRLQSQASGPPIRPRLRLKQPNQSRPVRSTGGRRNHPRSPSFATKSLIWKRNPASVHRSHWTPITIRRLSASPPPKRVDNAFDNAFIEAFNGRFRTSYLSTRWYPGLADACKKTESWCRYSDERRHHGAVEIEQNITTVLLCSGGAASPSPQSKPKNRDPGGLRDLAGNDKQGCSSNRNLFKRMSWGGIHSWSSIYSGTASWNCKTSNRFSAPPISGRLYAPDAIESYLLRRHAPS